MYELISDAHALIVDPVVSHADEAEPVDPEQLYIEGTLNLCASTTIRKVRLAPRFVRKLPSHNR